MRCVEHTTQPPPIPEIQISTAIGNPKSMRMVLSAHQRAIELGVLTHTTLKEGGLGVGVLQDTLDYEF
jgi:hypothetical protein